MVRKRAMALRHLRIAAPCNASFDAMEGPGNRRFCESCEKHVHDLSAGTETEARRILDDANGGRICVRYAKRPDGTIRFRAAAAAIALSLAACSAAEGTSDPVEPNAANVPTPPPQPAPSADSDAGPDDTEFLMGDIDLSVAE